MEAAIILAAVGQRYRFTLDPDAVIGIKPQITLLPANGIPPPLSVADTRAATNPLLICTMPSSRMISSRGANNVTGQRDAYECPLWVISGHW